MSAPMQSQSRPTPHTTFESYDLAHPSRSRASYRQDDDIFDTLFPQPPPRSRIQAERLARPSLPSLKAAAAQNDSADSSRSTAQYISSSNSIGSVNSLSSYPSSTSSLSLLLTSHPYKQGSGDSSIDYYSPAVSDVNSTETDHSASSSHAHSQSSEIDVHDVGDPLTPLTPNGATHTWRPKELNLVRKRQVTVPAEPSIPTYHATPSWNASPAISGDRTALLIGLGLGGVGLNGPSIAQTPTGLPADKLVPSKQGRAFLASKSPQLATTSALSRDGVVSMNAPAGPSQGPKQLLLVSSGGPPAVRRFPGRRPSEGLHEPFTSTFPPPPASEHGSRASTPQMRCAIPVMPSGPAFVDPRAPSPDPSSLLHVDRSAGPSAEEFLAQIASTPEYQASKYFEGASSSSAWLEQPIPETKAESQYDRPSSTAASDVAVDHSDGTDGREALNAAGPTQTQSATTASHGLIALPAKAQGFSSTQRSRAASLSRRKAPPVPLVLTSSPTTSNSDTLPGSSGGHRRRSLTATINQRSPLSASHSQCSSAGRLTPVETPCSAASGSGSRQEDRATDYSEPLHPAFFDCDTENQETRNLVQSKPSSIPVDGPSIADDSSHTSSDSAASVRPERGVVLARIMTESRDSGFSLASSRLESLRGDQISRDSSGSELAAAFEFADLETESPKEGLSLQTMMGFLARQDTQKRSIHTQSTDADHESNEQNGAGHLMAAGNTDVEGTSTAHGSSEQILTASPDALRQSKQLDLHSASATTAVPSFNISIFGTSKSADMKSSGSLQISVRPKDDGVDDAQTPVPATPTTRSRKQSMVPAPPSFAIRDASGKEDQPAVSPLLSPIVPDGFEIRPIIVRAPSNEAPAGSSRWSSGSESDGEAGMSIKGGRRKSLSKGRKSFSTSRKNSVAITRELINGPASAKEAVVEVNKGQSKRTSKTRLSGQSGLPAPLPVPSKSSTSISKRLLLNGLPSLRKKSFSSLNGQSASPSTPTSARTPGFASPALLDRSEFPFPPPASSHLAMLPPAPGMTSRPLGREGSADLMIRTASAATFASSSNASAPSPRTPLSAPRATASDVSDGPLTTQQILAQARNNVWPENYIGTGVSSAGLSSPFLSADHDTFSWNFAPSRIAPTPPVSGSMPIPRIGWASAPHTPPMPQSPMNGPSAVFMDKSLPSTPVDGSTDMGRSRSHTAGVAAPPKNLRHLRQSSSNTNLDKARRAVPADVFKPTHASVTSIDASVSSSASIVQAASPRQDVFEGDEEKLPTIAESSMSRVAIDNELLSHVGASLADAVQSPVLVNRQQAKLQKARRNRRQNDRFPRYNSWSDFGLQWLAERGEEAFETLAAESIPSSAILAAAGASAGNSSPILAGGSGGGDGDGESDASDTDDYGSSDGGGGAGGFGGAGGGGGGRQPGRNDADATDDEEEEDSDEDEEADAMTDGDSDDNYGEVEPSGRARRGPMPTFPARKTSIATTQDDVHEDTHSDSSDDRPLGLLVNDPRALQKALRAQERKRHFALAQQALEGKNSSSTTPSTSSHAPRAAQVLAPSSKTEGVLNSNELAQKLAMVQGRRERAQAPNAAIMQRSQTVPRQDPGRSADTRLQVNPASVARSKSVRTAPAERFVHPGLRARTPSEAALRVKAMAQAMPQGPSPTSPTLGGMAVMPDLPSNAMATVAAAQKAMAHAQAHPSPAAMAQAQALATSATAALNAATAQVKLGNSSPISPSFNQGEPIGYATTSPRIPDGVELPTNRQRSDSRNQAFPVTTSAAMTSSAAAIAPAHQPGMFQRLRSRSISRPNPLTINTAAAPPMPDLPRPGTGSKDSQASSSPRSAHVATFASNAQAASQLGESHLAQMQRAASNRPTTASSSHETGPSPGALIPEPRQLHKVFILSRQRFTIVEVSVNARARDLALEVIDREKLPMDDSKGGWVVFDCSAQLGIERPLREYEMITEVVNVRAHPKTDFFLIKRTELSPYLSVRSVPAGSPALAGYVYVQDRKKKWNKRWLELRDHGLYHAKNEKGKDEVAICQISSFDVYLVDGSAIKMPKANGFALRSQDPITMFEKPDQDYMHYFCLTDPAAHRDWVRAILNARTYILRQEKAALFQMDSPAPEAGAVASGGLSRRNTSRRPNPRSAAAAGAEPVPSSAAGPSPQAPLIDSSIFAGPFAKGSLLADKAISDAQEALRGHTVVAAPSGAFADLRLNEARRRDEAIERQRKMRADGQPLVDLARK